MGFSVVLDPISLVGWTWLVPLAESLMHITHKIRNTLGVPKSSSDWINYTGFPGDVCVVFFNVPPGNKDAMVPKPLTEEESRHVYNCDDECVSGSTKLWVFKSMWGCFHAPKHDAARNKMWLVALPVSQMASWVGFDHSKWPRFPVLLLSVWRSDYTRLGPLWLSPYAKTEMMELIYESVMLVFN